ncbi:unnamed protein product [Caenorhabditis sp. 36 PRJEB53466]|nr:unnamed protein product [Caenorhabditis sp. 36 PRJEB53466]
MTVEVADEVYFPENKHVYTFELEPDTLKVITDIRAKFGRPGLVFVHSGPIERLGVADAMIKVVRWNTERNIIAPKEVYLPFTGFKIEIKCDRNWYGPQCNRPCDGHMAGLLGLRCNEQGFPGCLEGWHGENCEKKISNRLPECRCENRGVCASTRTMSGRSELICECPIGFEGRKCETEGFDYVDEIEYPMKEIQGKRALFEEFFNGTASKLLNELA